MLIAQHVPDDVWAALPRRRLPRGRVIAVLLVLAALVVGGYAVRQAGYLTPNISAQGYGGSWTKDSGHFSTVTTLANDGLVATTIDSAAVDGGWLRLDRVTHTDLEVPGATAPDTFPITLEPHQSVSLEFWFTVSDCARVDRFGQTLTVSASSPLRSTMVTVTPAGEQDPEAPSSYSWTGGVDPWVVPWPGAYAAGACGVHLPPKQP